MLQCACDLVNVLPYPFLREANVFLDSFLNNELQVSFFSPFDRNKELIQLVINKPVEVFDNIRVV